jgi:hypothetical protein
VDVKINGKLAAEWDDRFMILPALERRESFFSDRSSSVAKICDNLGQGHHSQALH